MPKGTEDPESTEDSEVPSIPEILEILEISGYEFVVKTKEKPI